MNALVQLDDGLPTFELACEEGPPMHPDVVSPIPASRPRPRAGTWLLRALAAIALLVVVSCAGCSAVSAEAHHELDVNAASAQGFYGDWETLSPVDRKHAYWCAGRCFWNLRNSIYGDVIPTVFLADPFVPVISTPAPTKEGPK